MKLIAFLTVFGLGLVGCGKGKGYQGVSDLCSFEFVSDYNQTRLNSALLPEFKQKYAGVSCKAKMSRNDRLADYESYITVDSL